MHIEDQGEHLPSQLTLALYRRHSPERYAIVHLCLIDSIYLLCSTVQYNTIPPLRSRNTPESGSGPCTPVDTIVPVGSLWGGWMMRCTRSFTPSEVRILLSLSLSNKSRRWYETIIVGSCRREGQWSRVGRKREKQRERERVCTHTPFLCFSPSTRR
jgi:hypothetical protein